MNASSIVIASSQNTARLEASAPPIQERDLRALLERGAEDEVYRQALADPTILARCQNVDVHTAILCGAAQRVAAAGRRPADMQLLPPLGLVQAAFQAIPLRKISGAVRDRLYMQAWQRWCDVVRLTSAVDTLPPLLDRLLAFNLGSVPDIRAGLLVKAADLGLEWTLSPRLVACLLDYIDRPYIFGNAEDYLRLLAFRVHIHAAQGAPRDVREADVAHWYAGLNRAGRPPLWRLKRGFGLGRQRRRVHSVIASFQPRPSELPSIWRTLAIALQALRSRDPVMTQRLMQLDYWLWIRRKLDMQLPGRWWYRLIQAQARRAGFAAPRLVGEALPDIPPSGGLRVLPAGMVVAGLGQAPLITRIQGGLGDVLMMRPGLLALAARTPGGRVAFATNPALFPAFSIDDPVDLIDIETARIETAAFPAWYNFSDCPASRVEVRESPAIRTNRIDIFAAALGVDLNAPSARTRPLSFSPDYAVQADRLLAKVWPPSPGAPARYRIGIQLRAAEAYRDAPALLEAARVLGQTHDVFVFDKDPIALGAEDRVIPVTGQPLPVALALAARMDLLITPDSSFLHLAGANGVPCIGLFGPTDGAVRVSGYPSVEALDMREEFGCSPCWRHQFSKCRLGDGEQSLCMTQLPVMAIVSAANKRLQALPPPDARALVA